MSLLYLLGNCPNILGCLDNAELRRPCLVPCSRELVHADLQRGNPASIASLVSASNARAMSGSRIKDWFVANVRVVLLAVPFSFLMRTILLKYTFHVCVFSIGRP